MRISTLQSYANPLDSMQRAQGNLLKTQEQIATGKRLLSSADDPVAAVQVLKLNQELVDNQRNLASIDAAERQLSLEDLSLAEVDNATQRVREIAIAAGNGTYNQSDLGSLAVELEQLLEQMKGAMNAKNPQGEYLFAGGKGQSEPFVFDPVSERYQYAGDDTKRYTQVGPGQQLPFTDVGSEVFQTIDLPIAVVKLGSDTSLVESEAVVDAEVFREFSQGAGDVTITFSNVGGVTTYSVVDSGGSFAQDNSTPPQDLSGRSYQAGDTIAFGGLEMRVPNVVADGESIVLRAEEDKSNLLNTVQDLITALKQPISNEERQERIGQVVSELDQGMGHYLEVRTSVGSRLSQLETARERGMDFQLQTEAAISSLEDLDFAEAVTRLTMQETVLQAAQSSFVKVQSLSLFNYMR